MGKLQQDHHHHQHQNSCNPTCFSYTTCLSLLLRISLSSRLKAGLISLLTLALLVSGIFWILPSHHKSGFDASDAIKRSAPVQAYFGLHKPVLELFPHIGRLEYDINAEIGVPDTKVAVLSMHQSGASNWTDIVFGVLSDPINIPINSVSLSLLQSSLIQLFLQQSNLTLTSAIFGQPSMFEILKFPGGVTVVPSQSISIWQIPQILFKFNLNNSISDIEENFAQFRDELRFGLHLRPYENVYVLVTNKDGCTISSPITIRASVMSNQGSLLPQRLKQLAQAISDSPDKNLGLDNVVFGKVNSVTLSSYLEDTLEASPPVPLPCPSPVSPSISPHPAQSPSYSHNHPPCLNCKASSPSGHHHAHARHHKRGRHHSKHPAPSSPAPSFAPIQPPQHSPCHQHRIPAILSPSDHTRLAAHTPKMAPMSQLPPKLSPLHHVSYASSSAGQLSPSIPPPSLAGSMSSLAIGTFYKEILLLEVSALLIFYLFCLPYW